MIWTNSKIEHPAMPKGEATIKLFCWQAHTGKYFEGDWDGKNQSPNGELVVTIPCHNKNEPYLEMINFASYWMIPDAPEKEKAQ